MPLGHHDPRSLLCGADCKIQVLFLDPRRYIDHTSTGTEALIVPYNYGSDPRAGCYAFQFAAGSYWHETFQIPAGLDFGKGDVGYQTTFMLDTTPLAVNTIKLKFSFYHLYEGLSMSGLAPAYVFETDLLVAPAMIADTYFAGKMDNAMDMSVFQTDRKATDRIGVTIERVSAGNTYPGNLLLMDGRVFCFHTGEVGLTI